MMPVPPKTNVSVGVAPSMKLNAFVLAATMLLAPLAYAHHSFRSTYDFSKSETVTGVVHRLEFVNPHIKLYIGVTGEGGAIEEWLVEGPGKLALARRGWTDDMFKPGEAVTAVGKPSASGQKAIWFDKLVLSNGKEYLDPLLEDELAIEAQRRERAQQVNHGP